jgi:protein-S-isoprenylcysteine O-methyltransferase Ste14
MSVISLSPQRILITSGPFHLSRNPLYLGRNLLIFLGSALLFGSPAAIGITFVHLPIVYFFIRREKRQLESGFGDEWRQYRSRTPRWL